MASRFTSTIKLYKVDEIQKGHIPVFSSIANQTAFFEARKVKEIPNCKIVRNGPTVRVNLSSAQVYGVNYISYINPDFGNKVIYSFVMSTPAYINDQTTEIAVSEDPLQTWMFDIDIDRFSTVIEREMSSQENATIAATNPYDEALWEYDTPEHLPVSTELELRQYDFDEYETTAQRSNIRDSVAAKLFKTEGSDNLKDMLIISPINWSELDTAWEKTEHDPLDVKPSDDWQNTLELASQNAPGTVQGTGNFVVYPNGDIMVDGAIDSSKSLSNKYPTSCTIIVCGRGLRAQIINKLVGYNLLSTIVNAFKVPQNLLDYAFSISDTHTLTFTPPDTSAYHNKKLARFPFSYFRIVTPALDAKEYKYEMIESLRDGDNLFQIGIYTDIVNNITIYATPYDYRYKLLSSDLDSSEAISFDQFPTAPLSIDAFLAQMSALASQTTRQKTVSNNMRFSSDINQAELRTNPIYNTAETIGAVGGAAMDLAASTMGGIDTNSTAPSETGFNPVATTKIGKLSTNLIDAAVAQGKRSADAEILKHQADIIRNSTAYLVANDHNGVFAQEYAATRAGYAANIYTPAKGPGFEHYAEFGWLNLGIVKVTLREEILDRYDKYFDVYGYTSGRIGKPFVMYFIKGNVSPNSLPEWRNGETYCKTTECHVIAPYQYVSTVWETAFNAGTHWVNGDDLING